MKLPSRTVADQAAQFNFEALERLLDYQFVGNGTPEGVVTAPVGSTYHRRDGGALTSFYVKESGTGNTGWVAK